MSYSLGRMMKKCVFCFLFLTILLTSCGAKRETVLDRVVVVHDELTLEVPDLPRLCLELDLEVDSFNVNGTMLYVEAEGSGVPLVLLHGGPGATHHYFHPWFSRAAEFARVIYYDQRGCGMSGYDPGKGYSTSQAAEDLECLRIAMGIDNWVVLGHSYGGLLAQIYAQRYPEHLAGLVLVCSATSNDLQLGRSRQADFLSLEERIRISEIAGLEELTIAQRIYNRQLNGDWKRQSYYRPTVEQIARLALYEYLSDPLFRNRVLCDWHRFHVDGTIEEHGIPMLVIEAAWDLSWSCEKPEALHSQYPTSELVILEGSGHSPFSDQPDEFFQLLEDICHY